MSRIYFLLGGARSGKSTFGEKLAISFSNRVAYLATAKITDVEMKKRVLQHKQRRPGGWKTYEFEGQQIKNVDIDNIFTDIELEKIDTILIDCITNLLFRIIDRYDLSDKEIISSKIEKEIKAEVESFFNNFLGRLKKSNLNVIIVSNEIGLGVVPAFPLGRVFRDLAGVVNREIAEMADEVYFFVAGLKQRLK